MRFRTTLFLLLAVVLLGGAVFFFERGTESTRQREERTRKAFVFRASEVTYVRFDSTNLVAECIRQPDGQWRLVQPVRARAESGQLDYILRQLQNLPGGEIITPAQRQARGLSLSDYGLQVPRFRIVLDEGRRRQTILVGRDALLGDKVYVMEASQPNIRIADRRLLELIPASESVLRDPALFPGRPDQVQRLEIQRGDGFVQIARVDRNRWMIQQPLAARASATAVQQLLDRLFALRAREFVPGNLTDPAAYGFDEPGLRLTLVSGAGVGESSLWVGDAADKNGLLRYALIRPDETVGVVEAKAIEAVSLTVEDLRDRCLTGLGPGDIGRIVLSQGDQKIDLRLVDGEWRLTEPRIWKADADRVRELLAAWTAASIRSFPTPPTNLLDWGFSPTALTVRLIGREPVHPAGLSTAPTAALVEETIVVVGTQRRDNQRMVLLQPEGTVAAIGEELAASVSLDAFFYRDRQVLNLSPEDVMKISVRRGGREQTIERDAAGQFVPAPPVTNAVDPVAVDALLRTLQDLRAVRFIPGFSEEQPLWGLGSPKGVLKVGLRGTAGLAKTILLGADAGPRTLYAMIQGQDTVFELEKSDSARLLPTLYAEPAPRPAGTNVMDRVGSPDLPDGY